MREKLTDSFGRRVEYLRVSVTDRCNLACTYCMPPNGFELAPRCDMLPFKDLLDLIDIFAELGVRKVRLTGGEPLIRKGIVGFIHQLSDIDGIDQIALTTNGLLLGRMAEELKEAGVMRVNVSLDSLIPERFTSITGGDGLQKAREGIEAALAAGFESVKVNMVVMRGINDDEIEEFAELSRRMAAQVRFIEFMPATPEVWHEKRLMPMTVVKERVERLGKLTPCGRAQWGGPAEIYRLEGAAGEVGFISAVTKHFCESCNRMRLTATGGLMTCLFGESALDLRQWLRRKAPRDKIVEVIRAAVLERAEVRVLPTASGESSRPIMTSIGG